MARGRMSALTCHRYEAAARLRSGELHLRVHLIVVYPAVPQELSGLPDARAPTRTP
jgi:hypothetical protein